MLSLEEGSTLVRLARKVISNQFSLFPLRVSKSDQSLFNTSYGCFVHIYEEGKLRGSYGFIETGMPLSESVVLAARRAAFHDPRFDAVKRSDLSKITIEVNVLTKPKRVDVRNPEHYISKIHPGKDGVLIRGTFNEGYVLPQWATEHHWDSSHILMHACKNAQLPHDSWQNFEETRVYTFLGQVFSEQDPKGSVIQLL